MTRSEQEKFNKGMVDKFFSMYSGMLTIDITKADEEFTTIMIADPIEKHMFFWRDLTLKIQIWILMYGMDRATIYINIDLEALYEHDSVEVDSVEVDEDGIFRKGLDHWPTQKEIVELSEAAIQKELDKLKPLTFKLK